MVTFHLSRSGWQELFLANVAHIPIFPVDSFESGKAPQVGTGPFRVASFDAEKNRLELDANDAYWEGAPQIKRLSIQSVLEFQELYAGFKSGTVDFSFSPANVSKAEMESLAGLPGVMIENFEGPNIRYLGLNTKAPPLADRRVRQAIAHAIDREQLLHEHLDGGVRPAFSILPVKSWADSAGTVYDFDLAAAERLVRVSGATKDPIVMYVSKGDLRFHPIAESIREALNKVGLKVTVELIEPGTLRARLSTGEFQISVGQWIGGNQEPLFLRSVPLIEDTESGCPLLQPGTIRQSGR